MIANLILLALLAFAAWRLIFWVQDNFDRVARAGLLLVRVLIGVAYAGAVVALPAWAYQHPADGRSGWVWAVYLVAAVLSLVALGVPSARKRSGVLSDAPRGGLRP